MRAWIAWGFIVAAMVALPAQAQSWLDSLLSPEEAFRMTAYLAAPDRLVVRVHVADAYALYRERLEVLSTEGFAVSRVDIPRGHIETDPELGEIEKLTGDFEIALWGHQQSDAPTVTVKSQGCAEAGVCLTPTRRTLRAD